MDEAEADDDVSLDATPGNPGVTEAELRDLEVPADWHGERLDRTLAALVPEFSRSHLQHLLQGGAVQWRGQTAGKAAARVLAGDRIRVELRPTPQASAFVPEPMSLSVVHEDEHLLVIDKPAGLVVHPAAGHWSGTLLNGLLAYHRAAAELPRAGIVHRLDKDTSGLMLVGKTRPAVDALVRAIAAREVGRQYLALAHGPWRGPDSVDVDRPIGRDPQNRLRMAAVASGKPARTTLVRLDDREDACLVACRLHTGRTHQIRVHMGLMGHPLVGDAVYGGRPAWGLQRQALHAASLGLAHPVHGGALCFWSPPPADFAQALAGSGLRYNPPTPGRLLLDRPGD
jgi:23S rRNA pseudouridine1911/1915/1917 synthase